MQHSSPRSKTSRSIGFTLVEMLIIAPLVILALGGFISLMVTMVGDVMATRDENAMMHDTQDALSRIEDDVNLSERFLATSGTLPSPQGSSATFNGTGAFSSNATTLVLSTFATTRSPLDPLREIVYYKNQPNPCDSTKTINTIMYAKTIYFVYNNALWRRTVLPTFNTNATVDAQTVCVAPWQRDSCSPGYTASRCKTNDMRVMSDVSSILINYYNSPGGTTEVGPESASTIKVTLTGRKSSAGRPIEITLSMRAQKLNSNTP